jgi:hypothetical protein
MKIALASKFSYNEINKNVTQIINDIKLLNTRVDLISYGEAFLHGFNSLTWDY